MSQSFGAGMGPILFDNVTCNQSHSELLQCMHPLDIGIHNCDRENVAGVVCPNVSATTTTNTPLTPNTGTTPQNNNYTFLHIVSLQQTP